MRIYIKLSKNLEVVPFNYQSRLVGTLHKWLANNEIHDGLSLYSFSWLTNGHKVLDGLEFLNGSSWFISCHDDHQIKTIIKGIQTDNKVMCGMEVQEVSIQSNPHFETNKRFMVASPVFIKQTIDGKQKFYFYNNPESAELMTSTLKNKLKTAGLNSENVKVEFDSSFLNAKTKTSNYKGILNKGSVCPIIIHGSPEQIAFAWNVGIGNSTGIGFGSLI